MNPHGPRHTIHMNSNTVHPHGLIHMDSYTWTHTQCTSVDSNIMHPHGLRHNTSTWTHTQCTSVDSNIMHPHGLKHNASTWRMHPHGLKTQGVTWSQRIMHPARWEGAQVRWKKRGRAMNECMNDQ